MPVIAAYYEMAHLKQLYRQGWLRRGVPKDRCESVAEHSFSVAMLALWLADRVCAPLDVNKALRMALLHDFGEIYAGDFTPADLISEDEKSRLEEELVRQVLAKLPDGPAYIALWEEFEAGAAWKPASYASLTGSRWVCRRRSTATPGCLGWKSF